MKLVPWKMPSPEERRRNIAKMRWAYTLGSSALLLTLLIGGWYLYQSLLANSLNWTVFLLPSIRPLFYRLLFALLFSLFLAYEAVRSWQAWHQIREKDRLRKWQESHVTPTEGVWPPPPTVE